MRKILVVLSISIILLFVSCSDASNPSKDQSPRLKIVSNVSSVQPSSKAADTGATVEGVKLVYHNGYAATETGMSVTDRNTFYLEYVGDVKTDPETGKKYNYVLYVPECIRSEYCDATGEKNNNGNSFWWYMDEYYENVGGQRTDWEKQVQELISHVDDSLDYPNQLDVDDGWKLVSKRNMAEFIKVKSDGYKTDDNKTDNPTHKMNSFWFDTYGDENKPFLHFPCYITDVYATGGGKADNYDAAVEQSFLWYMDKYYQKSLDELIVMYKNGSLESFITTVNSDYSYSQVKPEDVPTQYKTVVEKTIEPQSDTEKVVFHSIFCYGEDCLADNDGEIITDNTRPYIVTWTKPNTRYITLLVPEKFVRDYSNGPISENKGTGPNRWEVYGGCFWNCIIALNLASEEEVKNLIDNEGCRVPASWVQKVMEYSTTNN